MLWRLNAPLREADACRRQNLAIAQALGGDTAVVNPSRVLRLGGSIAWPRKQGRIVEQTELKLFDDGRPKEYLPEQIAKAFPPVEVQSPSTPTSPELSATSSPSITPLDSIMQLQIGTSNLSVDACLSRIRAGDQWHINLVRLTGHWISRGWSDAEILTAAEALTLSGYTVADTRREVEPMIVGGRRKWAVPNPEHNVENEPAVPPLDLMAWTADRYAGEARPIKWLCKGTIPLGIPALIAAMGGLGKSYLALELALQIAAGVAGLEQPRLILGGRIAVDGAAVVITAEDGFDAVHRRLNRIDPTSRRLRHPKRLIVLPLPDAGGARPLITTNNKALARSPFLEELKRQLLEIKDLRLVVIDPLQAFVLADVNADPAAAQFLWSAMAEIASSTGATVLLTHHMRKDGMMKITDGDDAREGIRGTTALVDGARLVYALWKLDDETAKPICEQLEIPFERGRLVRGAVVKANDEADYSAHTYQREESGLLVQFESEAPSEKSSEPTFTIAQAREVLKEVDRRFEAGTPFSHSPQGRARYLGHYLTRQLRIGRRAAEQLIADWINNGVLTIEVGNRKTKLSGLKVQQWI
jgi:RecA/RadA recombinase